MPHRLAGAARVLVLAALGVALLLSVGAAAQTATVAQGVGAPQFRVNVSEALLKIVVYPDGAIQPLYRLDASVSLGSTELRGKLVFTSKSDYTGRESVSETRLEAYFTGIDVGDAQRARLEASGSYSFAAGEGAAEAKARLTATKEGEEYTLELRRLTLRLSGGKQLVVELEALVPRELLKEVDMEKPPDINEVNRRLAEAGFSYIRVENLAVGMAADGPLSVQARVTVDIDGMLRAAMANGLSREDAEAVRSLIEAPYRVEGSFRLEAEVHAANRELRANLYYASSSRGNLVELSQLAAETSESLNALVIALLRPLLAKNPEAAVALTQAQSLRGLAGPAMITKPPSSSSTRIELVVEGNVLRLNVDYRGPRLYVPASSPSAAAEKALAVFATQYQQMLSVLGQLEILAPGASQMLPIRVTLEPADPCVKLSKTSVTAAQLTTVKIDLARCNTAATQQTETKTTALPTATTQTKTETVQQTTITTTTTTVTAIVTETTTATWRQTTTAAAATGAAAETGAAPGGAAAPVQQEGQTATTTRQGGEPGFPAGVVLAAAVAAIAAAVVALVMRR